MAENRPAVTRRTASKVAARRASGRARSARERLLEAAEELFYDEGVNTVGIERVIARAGVAKASLYDCFGSKEELIRSYLAARHEARKVRVQERLARHTDPRARLLAVFESMAEALAEPRYRGCAFVRASAEAQAGSAIQKVVAESRAWLHALFAGLAREAGAPDAEALGRKLVLLYDGAAVSAQLDHDPEVALAARDVAAQMLDAAIAKGSAKPRTARKR